MDEVFEGQRELFFAIVQNRVIILGGWYESDVELLKAMAALEKCFGMTVIVKRGNLKFAAPELRMRC